MKKSESVLIKKIHIQTKKWRFKGTIPENENTLAGKIWHVNKKIHTITYESDDSGIFRSFRMPRGINVFSPLVNKQTLQNALHEIEMLFIQQERIPTFEFDERENYCKMRVLFTYRNAMEIVPNYERVIRILQNNNATHVANIVDSYVKNSLLFVNGSLDAISTCHVELIRYSKGGSFFSHIDNVVDSENELWPVYTIHLGNAPKMFDFLPSALPDKAPFRVITEIGDLLMMDSHARIDYSHTIPVSNEQRYTVFFYFKPSSMKIVGYNSLFKTNVMECIPAASLNKNEHITIPENVMQTPTIQIQEGKIGTDKESLSSSIQSPEYVYPPATTETGFIKSNPKLCKLLTSKTRKWKFNLSQVPDEYATTLASRIWYVNKVTRVDSWVSDRTIPYHGLAPHGLYVFEKISDIVQATNEVIMLFEQEKYNPTIQCYPAQWNHSIHLFETVNPDLPQPTYFHVMDILKMRTPALASMAELLASYALQFMHCKKESLIPATLSIVKYEPCGGIQSHIDNIPRLGHSVGPVFLLSLGKMKVKLFDLFPCICKSKNAHPLRIATDTGDVIVIDSVARMEWSHAVPKGGCDQDSFTLMLKFRQVSSKVVCRSEILKVDIFDSTKSNYTPAC